MLSKQCKKCNTTKPLTMFQKDVSKKDNNRPECKECTAKRRKERYCPDTARKNNLASKFTGKKAPEFYEETLKKQGGVCAICQSKENGRYKHLSIDHCHTAGNLRGLLCNNCNRAIGLLKDSVEVLRNAITYLSKEKK